MKILISGSGGGLRTLVVFYLLLVPAYLLPFAVWHCITTNHVFSVTRIDDVRLEMRLDALVYWWILSTNAFAAVLTLGMAIPWAQVRMARYKLSCLVVTGDLDHFEGDVREDPAATGEFGQAVHGIAAQICGAVDQPLVLDDL